MRNLSEKILVLIQTKLSKSSIIIRILKYIIYVYDNRIKIIKKIAFKFYEHSLLVYTILCFSK